MTRKWRDSKGREVCDVEFDGSGRETFIARATYLDDWTDVPDDELDWMAEGECLCLQCREAA